VIQQRPQGNDNNSNDVPTQEAPQGNDNNDGVPTQEAPQGNDNNDGVPTQEAPQGNNSNNTTNLVVNGDAEDGINGWTISQGEGFGARSDHEVNETNHFMGIDTQGVSAYQNIDVAGLSGSRFHFEADQGGWISEDTSEVSVTFLDINGNMVGEKTSLGVQTGERYEAMQNHSIDGIIPDDAITAKIEIDIDREAGRDADGYVDNIVFSVEDGSDTDNIEYTDTDVVFDVADDIDLDFSDDTLDNLHDISEINMDNGSANSIDGITLDDILEMTDDNNTLTITGDDNDMLNIDTNGWEQTTPAITNADTGMTTYEYANTSGDIITLNIDEQIHSTGM
jgi:hypothetical protein